MLQSSSDVGMALEPFGGRATRGATGSGRIVEISRLEKGARSIWVIWGIEQLPSIVRTDQP